MNEIILSFFAVIGITLLGSYLFDTYFYSKFSVTAKVLLDLRGKCEEEAIQALELLAAVNGRKSGAVLLKNTVILTDSSCGLGVEGIYRYAKAFDLNLKVFSNVEQFHQTVF